MALKLPEHLSYSKEEIEKLRTQKIFRYGDVKRFDDELDFLMGFVPDLVKDFLTEYEDIQACLEKGTTSAMGAIYSQLKRSKEGSPDKALRNKATLQGNEDIKELDIGDDSFLKGQTDEDGKITTDAWRVLVMKYHNPNIVGKGQDQGVQERMLRLRQAQDGYRASAFPTMMKIANHYKDLCPVLEYSILPAQSIIERHIGIENKKGENIRIHIPLIIPEGDLYLEATGEEVDWQHPWGFNNQHMHSAHNNSDEHRLIMLIDLKRTFVGIPPAKHFKDMTKEEIGDVHFKYARDNERSQPKISSSLSNKFRDPEEYI